jgi:hypothetical protein
MVGMNMFDVGVDINMFDVVASSWLPSSLVSQHCVQCLG